MKDRIKDPASRARPMLAKGAIPLHLPFTRMIFNT